MKAIILRQKNTFLYLTGNEKHPEMQIKLGKISSVGTFLKRVSGREKINGSLSLTQKSTDWSLFLHTYLNTDI